jgi:hypothetical protein
MSAVSLNHGVKVGKESPLAGVGQWVRSNAIETRRFMQ